MREVRQRVRADQEQGAVHFESRKQVQDGIWPHPWLLPGQAEVCQVLGQELQGLLKHLL